MKTRLMKMLHPSKIFGLLAVSAAFAAHPAAAQTSLKEAYEDDFLVGVALNDSHFAATNPGDEALIAAQFNSITPENALKWDAIHPDPDRYNFEAADRYVAFGEKHRMFVIGHTLVWHQQLPAWVLEENGRPVTREVALQRMRDHIQTVVGRYKGRIQGWDVVNEALEDDGSLRPSPWRQIIGDDYIEKAFQFAHEADPEAELYYNDYSLENAPKRKGAIDLVKKLQAAGVKIDGVGTQGHCKMNWPSTRLLDETLTELGQLGIKTMITELDVDVLPGRNNNGSAEITLREEADPALDPYTAGLPDEMQEKLARRYAEFFAVYRKHRGSLNRVTFWGVTDKGSWLNGWPIRGRTNYPLLFDRQSKPKPAFQAVVDASHSELEAPDPSPAPGAAQPADSGAKTSEPSAPPAGDGARAGRSQPNIVIFMADDLAWHDVACFGGPTDAKTPHLDKLADGGMKLTRFYSSSAVCAPVRQALLTGMYPVRSGAYPNHSVVKKGTRTLPSYLEALGYRTLGAGKRHFGPPRAYPFDTWLPMVGEDAAKGKDGDLDFAGVENFIRDGDGRPFFAYLATHEPHVPHTKWDASGFKPEDLKNIAPFLVDTPELRSGLSPYYAEVALCDDQVGQIMSILQRTGHDRDTLFFFFSEQGSSVPQGKWTLYNAGIRVAAIAAWPEHIAAGSTSSALVQYEDIAPTLIAAAGGDALQVKTGVADAVGHQGFDGKSILDVLLGRAATHRDYVFAQHTARGINNGPEAYGTRAVSDGRWKLLVNLQPENEFTTAISDAPLLRSWRRQGEKGDAFAARQAARYARRPALELYDLQADPWELTNVAERLENKETLALLQTELTAWMKQQGDKGHETEMEALDHQPRRKQEEEGKSADEA